MSQSNYPVCRMDEDPFDLGELFTKAEAYEDAVRGLVRAAQKVLAARQLGLAVDVSEWVTLDEAVEEMLPWLESDDPQSMGWVDDRGRP